MILVKWISAAFYSIRIDSLQERMAQGATYLKCKKKVANASSRPDTKKIQYRHKKSAAKFKKKGSTNSLRCLSSNVTFPLASDPTTEIRRGCNGFKKCGNKVRFMTSIRRLA